MHRRCQSEFPGFTRILPGPSPRAGHKLPRAAGGFRPAPHPDHRPDHRPPAPTQTGTQSRPEMTDRGGRSIADCSRHIVVRTTANRGGAGDDSRGRSGGRKRGAVEESGKKRTRSRRSLRSWAEIPRRSGAIPPTLAIPTPRSAGSGKTYRLAIEEAQGSGRDQGCGREQIAGRRHACCD